MTMILHLLSTKEVLKLCPSKTIVIDISLTRFNSNNVVNMFACCAMVIYMFVLVHILFEEISAPLNTFYFWLNYCFFTHFFGHLFITNSNWF